MTADQKHVVDFYLMKIGAVPIVLRLFKYFAGWNPILGLEQ